MCRDLWRLITTKRRDQATRANSGSPSARAGIDGRATTRDALLHSTPRPGIESAPSDPDSGSNPTDDREVDVLQFEADKMIDSPLSFPNSSNSRRRIDASARKVIINNRTRLRKRLLLRKTHGLVWLRAQEARAWENIRPPTRSMLDGVQPVPSVVAAISRCF